MDDVSASRLSTGSSHGTSSLRWIKHAICLGLAIVGVYLTWTLGHRLTDELRALAGEWATARDREPMGYVGIWSDLPERQPASCVREQDGRLLLWAGSGTKGQKGWFDVTGIHYPVQKFALASGRDRIKTIDYPIFEESDGAIARRIYPERPVIGLEYAESVRAYPVGILKKVLVVNEDFPNRSLAITYCPSHKEAVVYDRMLDGDLVSLGASGYLYDGEFLFYDRATDSMWMQEPQGLMAISGPLAGKVLSIVDRPKEISWGEWRQEHPNTQVLVGADRKQGIPLPNALETRQL